MNNGLNQIVKQERREAPSRILRVKSDHITSAAGERKPTAKIRNKREHMSVCYNIVQIMISFILLIPSDT